MGVRYAWKGGGVAVVVSWVSFEYGDSKLIGRWLTNKEVCLVWRQKCLSCTQDLQICIFAKLLRAKFERQAILLSADYSFNPWGIPSTQQAKKSIICQQNRRPRQNNPGTISDKKYSQQWPLTEKQLWFWTSQFKTQAKRNHDSNKTFLTTTTDKRTRLMLKSAIKFSKTLQNQWQCFLFKYWRRERWLQKTTCLGALIFACFDVTMYQTNYIQKFTCTMISNIYCSSSSICSSETASDG